MKTIADATSVSILGKELVIACPPGEREALQAAAAHLDRRMRDIQESGKVIGTERCAMMAALNISNELLQARKAGVTTVDIDRRLNAIYSRVDSVLREEQSKEV